MGASQVVSMQETGDGVRVGRTMYLLSKMLGSNGAQPGMVMALLWTPLVFGEQTDPHSCVVAPYNACWTQKRAAQLKREEV